MAGQIIVGLRNSGKTELAKKLSNSKPERDEKGLLWYRIGQNHNLCVISKGLPILKNCGTVILTLDKTKKLEIQKRYFQELKSGYSKEARFILAVTKDEVESKVNEGDISKLAKELGIKEEDIFYCSTRSKGIQALRSYLIKCKQKEQIDELEKYVMNHVISILYAERERLREKYKNTEYEIKNESRYKIITTTMTELFQVIDDIRNGKISIDNAEQVKEALRKPIEDNLVDFDKRKGAWGTKLALVLLNFISVCTGIVPVIKRATTGSWLFSRVGKTYEEGEKALEETKNVPVSVFKKKK